MARPSIPRDAEFTFSCDGEQVSLPKRLVSNLLFSDRPDVLKSDSYEIQSAVSPPIFTDFTRWLQGEKVPVTQHNFFGLVTLTGPIIKNTSYPLNQVGDGPVVEKQRAGWLPELWLGYF
jgi:hypothetical protein